MNVILYVYEAVLLVYTAYRTFDFLSYNLPAEIGQEIALLGLFAFDVGLLVWHQFYRKYARSTQQESMATAMIVIDFIGSFSAGVADMILRQTMLVDYAMPHILGVVLIYAIPAIVMANVAAVLFVQMHDPDEVERRTQRRVEAKVRSMAIAEIELGAAAIAKDLMPAVSNDIKKRVRNSITGKYSKSEPAAMPAMPEPVTITKNGNGYHAETVTPDPTPRRRSKS